MTIDFRVAIDWQDNGHVNWLQDADAESDPLNILTSASLAGYNLANATLGTVETNYGLDRAVASAAGTSAATIAVSSGIGQISVASSTTYTVAVWMRKSNAADNAKNLRIVVRQTTSGSSTILQSTASSYVANPASSTTHYLHSVTFTTTASAQRIYVTTDSNSGAFTGTYVVTGLMLVAGATAPTYFNDGTIKVITHRVVDARWNVGYRTSIVNGSVANENRLECSLYNLDDYITDAKYADVHRVYIEGSDDSGSTWTRLYTGWTYKWFPIFDSNNPDQHLRFTGVSSRFYLDGVKARLAVQESQTHLQIIQNIVAEAELPDSSSITVDTSTNPPGYNLKTYNYAGQNWDEEVDLLRALADTVGGYAYFCYFSRSDELEGFEIRDFNDPTISSDYTLTKTIRGTADFRYADPWLNGVNWKVYPRKLSTTNTNRLWRLPENYSISAGEVLTLLARYNDEDKPYQIGARDVSYDNAVFSSGSPTITLTPKSTSCYIEIDNSGGGATTLTDLRIIGQKVKTWDAYWTERVYNAEITVNGSNLLTNDYKITDNVREAQISAGWFLDVWGEKNHRLWSITVPGDRGEDSNLIDYPVNSVVTVAYPDSSSYKHRIIGEEWAWRSQGQYETKLYLERLYEAGQTITTRS